MIKWQWPAGEDEALTFFIWKSKAVFLIELLQAHPEGSRDLGERDVDTAGDPPVLPQLGQISDVQKNGWGDLHRRGKLLKLNGHVFLHVCISFGRDLTDHWNVSRSHVISWTGCTLASKQQCSAQCTKSINQYNIPIPKREKIKTMLTDQNKQDLWSR